jgi:5-methyltetrahydropteroyltriglutamate--homocysteine methyltransferase
MTRVDTHADQIGSLRRPPELLQARAARAQGELSAGQLRDMEDRSILEILRKQRDAGIGVLTDGEYRRDAWQTDINNALAGFSDSYPTMRWELPDGSFVEKQMHSKVITGRLRQLRRLAEHESRFLIDNGGKPAKVTLPSPAFIGVACYQSGVTDAVYPTRADLADDLVPIFQSELRALADEGVDYIQLDEGYTRFSSPDARARLQAEGLDPAAELARDIATENACFDAIAGADVTRAVHLCRGSRTRSRNQGDYDWLAERLFNQLHADRFLLEWETGDFGGFEPLRFLPRGKTVVLGLITSKYPELEDPDALVSRIEEAARYCPVDQLALSPQCGFSASSDNEFVSYDEQWRKLELVAATAERVWG